MACSGNKGGSSGNNKGGYNVLVSSTHERDGSYITIIGPRIINTRERWELYSYDRTRFFVMVIYHDKLYYSSALVSPEQDQSDRFSLNKLLYTELDVSLGRSNGVNRGFKKG